MTKLIYTSTHGSADPTRAAFPFILANGAREAGYEAEVFLSAEAVYLMKDVVANSMVPVGWPPLRELLQKAKDAGVQIHVWRVCSDARGVSEADLQGKNARFTSPKDFAIACAQATQVIGM